MELQQFNHDSFRAVVGTLVGYGLLLVVMAVLLFGIPYVIFTLL